MPLIKQQIYTIDDIYALPDGERAELIDGQCYMMAPPSRLHQRITVYNFDSEDMNEYSFADTIKAGIYPDLSICLADLGI